MKVCFWGNVAKALKGNTSGGGQLQIALVARALALAGNEVSVIDYETSEDYVTDEGIKVFKITGWNKGIRVFRSFTHRLPNLYRTLKQQKADIYYCRIRDFRHILAYWAAKRVKGKFILGLASNLDALNFKNRFKYQHKVSRGSVWAFCSGLLIEIIYPYLLRNADLVLVQHEGQKQALLKKNIKSLIFPNIIQKFESEAEDNKVQRDFIYVGRLDKRKGFSKFFEVVTKASSSHSFKVIGEPSDKHAEFYFKQLKDFKNVKLLGWFNHSETLKEIASSKALICTSPMEGFPNVFIEAWSLGIPVLSLYFDLGVIEKEKLGKVFNGNIENLISSMDQMIVTEEFIKNSKRYVQEKHLLTNSKIEGINNLFHSLLNGQKK